MKNIFYKYGLVVFIILVGVVIFWAVLEKSSRQRVVLLSPLSDGKEEVVPVDKFYQRVLRMHTIDLSSNKYFPQDLNIEDKTDLGIDAQAYIAYDRDSKKIILGKNITQRFPIASLTKIATAIVSLENASLTDELVVSSASASVGEATMGLSAGEKINVEEALYGLILPSGNDAAETLAEGIGKYKLGTPQTDVDGGGARKWFLDKMNEMVQGIGLFDTYFFNPTGLDGNDITHTNFSTALDLAILTNYALGNNTFAKLADTREMILPFKEGYHKAFYLYNILSLDGSYPGIKGVKPGISDFSMETLSSYNEKDGRKIIVVILGSQHTKDDAVKIYNEVYKTNFSS